jgi:polyferredoxin
VFWVFALEVKMGGMRRFLIGLTLVLLLAVSISVGVVVARWPHCRHVCPWICAW